MATRYIYKEKTYNSSYALRQAIGKEQRIAYGDITTEEGFAAIGVEVKIEEYDPQDEIPVETLRSQVMQQMLSSFNGYCNSSNTSIATSLGFPVNANISSVTNIDICLAQLEEGLVTLAEGESEATIEFRDFDDNMQSLTATQLKQIKAEVSANLSNARAKKWEYEAEIKEADRNALKSMHGFTFP